eukprot:CAMPEP_0204823248 /NCGR_PEP_ID=MMETSP1346-20131115/1325_1 /ASSEMBLY_ACC=CAM_ASM_000771 /TAXON_ID=215587 /ORGANISM="Aplanochytrium stocchinoi, Strain GSBS06" /LENGTH=243 /DNA_ID=CAMNT_0051949815 /DNA_START=1083 /DNA_END=1814 /DNA_ORIENTATION=+
MKYLDIPELSSLTSFLASCEIGSRQMRAKLEAYSCKQSGEYKKLGKQLEQSYVQELEESSSTTALGTSPIGALSDPQTRRLLINLICTMNASFPDYDFSTLKPEQFLKENLGMVVNSVNTRFAEIVETINKGFLKQLWSVIDQVIGLNNCQVFSYIPDFDNDPFSASGNLWSFNLFFFNKAEKKILFFACSCQHSRRFATLTPDTEIDVDGDCDNESTGSEGDQDIEFEDHFYMLHNEEDDLY